MAKYYRAKYRKTTIGEMKAEAKRRQILIKRIRCACGIVGGLAFMYILGITGGLEHDYITIGQYVSHTIPSLAVFALSIRISLGIGGEI